MYRSGGEQNVRSFDFDDIASAAVFDGIIKPTPVRSLPDGSAIIMELLRVEFQFGHHGTYASEYGGTAYLFAGDYRRHFGTAIFPPLSDAVLARLTHFRFTEAVGGGGSLPPGTIAPVTGGQVWTLDSNQVVDLSDGRGNGMLFAGRQMTFLATSVSAVRPLSCRIYYKPKHVSYAEYVAVGSAHQ